MRAYVESILKCDACRVWPVLLLSDTLRHISRPVLTLAPLKGEQLPPRWEHGATIRMRCWLLSFIPLGARTIFLETVDAAEMTIQTREHDRLARTWDHRMQVTALPDGASRYSDEIVIHAGWRTVFLWAFANLYYRHRQRRWRRLARRLRADSETRAH
jgi:hypothetical protein